MASYPYIIQHKNSKKYHIAVRRKSGGYKLPSTGCGHDPHNGNYEERSKTILDAVKEKKLCKVCLMADEVYDVIAETIKQSS